MTKKLPTLPKPTEPVNVRLLDILKMIVIDGESQMNDDKGQRFVEVSKSDIRKARAAIDAHLRARPSAAPEVQAPAMPQEPVAWRARFRWSGDKWGMWDLRETEPLGPITDGFQKEPLYASPIVPEPENKQADLSPPVPSSASKTALTLATTVGISLSLDRYNELLRDEQFRIAMLHEHVTEARPYVCSDCGNWTLVPRCTKCDNTYYTPPIIEDGQSRLHWRCHREHGHDGECDTHIREAPGPTPTDLLPSAEEIHRQFVDAMSRAACTGADTERHGSDERTANPNLPLSAAQAPLNPADALDAFIESVLKESVANGEDVAFHLQHGAGGVNAAVDAIMVREVARTIIRAVAMTDAARDVLAERKRQIEREGWTPEHDSDLDPGDLAAAAACYATGVPDAYTLQYSNGNEVWPWAPEEYKPKDQRRNNVRAAALMLAQIECDDRAAMKEPHHE